MLDGASRAAGMLRSLAIYHAIPLRQGRLRRFYSQFVGRGELVFDLGAHAGNRSRAFAAMGCRVVAIEPQPDFARLLRLLFSGSKNVDVLETAVGETAQRTSLMISDRTPTVTTVAAAWHAARSREPDFSHVSWNRQIDIDVITLDMLIDRFGVPAFVKIDVEGAEPSVLAGLSHPVRALSFEYLPRALDYARECVRRLDALGAYEYNWSLGESYRLAEDSWLTGAEVCAELAKAPAQRRPGDVYARLADSR